MKLVRFNGGRLGIISNSKALDITDALGVDPASWPPVQMVQFIAEFENKMPELLNHGAVKEFDLNTAKLEIPIAIPNTTLLIVRNHIVGAAPVRMEPAAKINDVTSITFLRPTISVMRPDPNAPNTAPTSTAVVTNS